jgi:hypothetical protein
VAFLNTEKWRACWTQLGYNGIVPQGASWILIYKIYKLLIDNI